MMLIGRALGRARAAIIKSSHCISTLGDVYLRIELAVMRQVTTSMNNLIQF